MKLDNLRKHMWSTIGVLCPFVDNSPYFSIEMSVIHSHGKGIERNSITVNNSGLRNIMWAFSRWVQTGQGILIT